MVIPYQLDSIVGSNGKIDMLVVRDLENNIKNIKADFFLPFFGLSNELGPIKEWELDIEKKTMDQGPLKGIELPCFLYKNNLIWGATAMILSEFKFFLASLSSN